MCYADSCFSCGFFFFKQKTAYEIGTGDWSSDVCSSDLTYLFRGCVPDDIAEVSLLVLYIPMEC